MGASSCNNFFTNSSDERLAKAIREREKLRWATRPPEIYAVAKPHPVKLQTQMPNSTYSPGTEEDEATVKKLAAEVASLYKP